MHCTLSSCFFFFLVAPSLHCFARTFSSCVDWEHSLLVVCRRLTAVASLAELRFQAHRLQQLLQMGSWVVAHRLGCTAACGIFPDQGSNLYPLPWQVGSYPLDHQESPPFFLFKKHHAFNRSTNGLKINSLCHPHCPSQNSLCWLIKTKSHDETKLLEVKINIKDRLDMLNFNYSMKIWKCETYSLKIEKS